MSNCSALRGFLIIELLIAFLFISFIILIIAHYQYFVIRWQQEVSDRLTLINYACNFFMGSPEDTERKGGENHKVFTMRYQSVNYAKPSRGLSGLIEPRDFVLHELIMSWTGQEQTEYSYKVIGRRCI